eukprot:scaffold447_cov307-Pinguiococcus_pyrenoidosus.AAC.38
MGFLRPAVEEAVQGILVEVLDDGLGPGLGLGLGLRQDFFFHLVPAGGATNFLRDGHGDEVCDRIGRNHALGHRFFDPRVQEVPLVLSLDGSVHAWRRHGDKQRQQEALMSTHLLAYVSMKRRGASPVKYHATGRPRRYTIVSGSQT